MKKQISIFFMVLLSSYLYSLSPQRINSNGNILLRRQELFKEYSLLRSALVYIYRASLDSFYNDNEFNIRYQNILSLIKKRIALLKKNAPSLQKQALSDPFLLNNGVQPRNYYDEYIIPISYKRDMPENIFREAIEPPDIVHQRTVDPPFKKIHEQETTSQLQLQKGKTVSDDNASSDQPNFVYLKEFSPNASILFSLQPLDIFADLVQMNNLHNNSFKELALISAGSFSEKVGLLERDELNSSVDCAVNVANDQYIIDKVAVAYVVINQLLQLHKEKPEQLDYEKDSEEKYKVMKKSFDSIAMNIDALNLNVDYKKRTYYKTRDQVYGREKSPKKSVSANNGRYKKRFTYYKPASYKPVSKNNLVDKNTSQKRPWRKLNDNMPQAKPYTRYDQKTKNSKRFWNRKQRLNNKKTASNLQNTIDSKASVNKEMKKNQSKWRSRKLRKKKKNINVYAKNDILITENTRKLEVSTMQQQLDSAIESMQSVLCVYKKIIFSINTHLILLKKQVEQLKKTKQFFFPLNGEKTIDYYGNRTSCSSDTTENVDPQMNYYNLATHIDVSSKVIYQSDQEMQARRTQPAFDDTNTIILDPMSSLRNDVLVMLDQSMTSLKEIQTDQRKIQLSHLKEYVRKQPMLANAIDSFKTLVVEKGAMPIATYQEDVSYINAERITTLQKDTRKQASDITILKALISKLQKQVADSLQLINTLQKNTVNQTVTIKQELIASNKELQKQIDNNFAHMTNQIQKHADDQVSKVKQELKVTMDELQNQVHDNAQNISKLPVSTHDWYTYSQHIVPQSNLLQLAFQNPEKSVNKKIDTVELKEDNKQDIKVPTDPISTLQESTESSILLDSTKSPAVNLKMAIERDQFAKQPSQLSIDQKTNWLQAQVKKELDSMLQKLKHNPDFGEFGMQTILELVDLEMEIIDYLISGNKGLKAENAVDTRDKVLKRSSPSIKWVYERIVDVASTFAIKLTEAPNRITEQDSINVSNILTNKEKKTIFKTNATSTCVLLCHYS